MSALSNLRKSPIDGAMSWRTMDTETHAVAEFAELPGKYGFILKDIPRPGFTTITENTTAATGRTIVTTEPNPGEVYIDFPSGNNSGRAYCMFNIADNGVSFHANYQGGGSAASLENLLTLINLETTDNLSEGSTNKYFTNARAQAQAIVAALTGYSVGSNAAIAATDTILQAFGKVQAQLNAAAGDVATQIHAASGKTTPVDADELGIWDSAVSALKRLTWANLKATLNTLYLPIAKLLGLRIAWATFTMSGSTITIRNSSGITSIVRNTTGDFTVTMSTARNNIYYQVIVQAATNYGVSFASAVQLNLSGNVESAPTTTVFSFTTVGLNLSTYDPKYVYFSIFENA